MCAFMIMFIVLQIQLLASYTMISTFKFLHKQFKKKFLGSYLYVHILLLVSFVFANFSSFVEMGWYYHLVLLLLGYALSYLATYLIHRFSLPFVYYPDESEWILSGKESSLTIPNSRHEKGCHCQVVIEELSNDMWEVVICGVTISNNGDVTISVNNTLSQFTCHILRVKII